MNAEIETQTAPDLKIDTVHEAWIELGDLIWRYRCEVRIFPDDDGYGAYVANLRGVVSQGDTEAEARENIEEALKATLKAYGKREIPWSEPERAASEERRLWLVVDA